MTGEKYTANMVRYQERKAAGICPRCGKAPLIPGLAVCQTCRDKASARSVTEHRRSYHREYASDLRSWRKARNLCIYCGGKDANTESGMIVCEACRQKRKGYEQRRRERARSAAADG